MKIDKETKKEYFEYVMWEYEQAIIRITRLDKFKSELQGNQLYDSQVEKAHEYEFALRKILRKELDLI